MLKGEENYFPMEEGKANYDVAYYFPLRNEKNSSFLKNHIAFLEDEIDAVQFRVDLTNCNHQSFEYMAQNLFRDIQIYRTRLIGLGIFEDYTTKAFNKTTLLDYLQSNMFTNVRCKMELIDRLTRQQTEEFDARNEQLLKAQAKRVGHNLGRGSF
jgi:hypothetical protein